MEELHGRGERGSHPRRAFTAARLQADQPGRLLAHHGQGRSTEEHGVLWKNIYSGIFRDLDEVLIPLEIVREGGRLPLKRGPKALQEKGIPFYDLTTEGLLIAISLEELSEREKILDQFLSQTNIEEKEFQESLQKLAKIAPQFTFSLFEKYSKAYCDGRLQKLLPFTLENLKKISNNSLRIQIEFLKSWEGLSKSDKEKTLEFLKKIS